MKPETNPKPGESTANPKKPKCVYAEYLLWLDRNPARFNGSKPNPAKNIK